MGFSDIKAQAVPFSAGTHPWRSRPHVHLMEAWTCSGEASPAELLEEGPGGVGDSPEEHQDEQREERMEGLGLSSLERRSFGVISVWPSTINCRGLQEQERL